MIFYVVDLFTWFNNNGMKANADKCHLLLSTKEKLKANISNYKIMSGDKEKLVGVTIDNHLKFESHIKKALKPVKNYMPSLGFPHIRALISAE